MSHPKSSACPGDFALVAVRPTVTGARRRTLSPTIMPSVPFGAIKALQARTGADRATCKKALEENGCDEDAAAAAIGEHTSVAAASSSKPSEAQAQLDSWAAQEQAASVSIVRQQAGDGETFPMVGDMCTMHYEGTLQSDGTVFDSSIKRNKPFRFKVGVADVIRGWDVGVMKMSLGEKAVLLIGPDYACTHPLTCMYCRVIHTLHAWVRVTSCLRRWRLGGWSHPAQCAPQVRSRAAAHRASGAARWRGQVWTGQGGEATGRQAFRRGRNGGGVGRSTKLGPEIDTELHRIELLHQGRVRGVEGEFGLKVLWTAPACRKKPRSCAVPNCRRWSGSSSCGASSLPTTHILIWNGSYDRFIQ